MKSKKLLLSLAVVAILISSQSLVYTYSAQPPAGRTGAPFDGASCATSGCHSGNTTLNSPSAVTVMTLGANDIADGYTPGLDYNITVTVQQQSAEHGFQMVAVDGSENQAGSFSAVGATNVQTANGREYINHQNASGSNAWSFVWSAPSSDIGPVTFYLAANSANGDGSNGGDAVYINSYQATTGSFSQNGISSVQTLNADNAEEVDMYPNPVDEQLTVEYFVEGHQPVSAELYDLAGKKIQDLFSYSNGNGHNMERLHLNVNGTGMYMVRMNIGEQVYFKKLLVQ